MGVYEINMVGHDARSHTHGIRAGAAYWGGAAIVMTIYALDHAAKVKLHTKLTFTLSVRRL